MVIERLTPLWTTHLPQQLSGYALVLVCGLSAGWVTIHKRWARLGAALPSARGVHAVLGVVSLLGVGVHTGSRLGHGLDRALTASLVAMIVVGATTTLTLLNDGWLGGPRGLALKRFGTRLHVWIAWPVPVLLALHVLKSYYF